MRASADPGLVKRLSVFASAAGLFSGAIGVSGLAGWAFHVRDLTTWGFAPVRMVPNTAVCFVLLGASLWILRKSDIRRSAWPGRFAANTAAAVTALVGLLSLIEHFVGRDFGIDQLLVRISVADHAAGVRPGLMSCLTAADFLILGLALLVLDWKTRRDDWPAQFLCFAAAVPTAFGLVALVLSPSTAPTSMAWPTTVTLLVLISGLLGSRATWALGGLLTGQTPGAKLLRRATPAALLVLSLIGWFISKPLLTESHFSWVEVGMLAVFCSALLAGFIAWVSILVERGDTARRKAEAALNIDQGQLDRLLKQAEVPESERLLRRRVTAGFGMAILLTGLLGFFSRYNSRRAAEDADWVTHTHQAATGLELLLRHLDDVETGARGFALTGDETFLQPYSMGKIAIGDDLRALRALIADTDQKQLLQILKEQVNGRIEAAQNLVTLRQRERKPPNEAALEPGKQMMDATRATIERMEARETYLLEQRTQRAHAAQHRNNTVIVLGAVLGSVFLTIAGATVNREIGISARARAQISTLNSDLERRVAQRTAALGESEGRLAGMIQSAMDAILTVDEEQKIVLFNAAAEIMFRCPAAEALGQPVTRFIPQRFHVAHAGHIHKFANTGITSRTMGPKNVLWAARSDGGEFQIEASISQVVTGGKKLFTVILRDVTERVRSEAVREHLASVVDSSDDAIISKDLHGTINAWNRGAENIFGYKAAEAVGKPMTFLMPLERAGEEQDILERIRRGESVEHFETVRMRKDGSKIDVSVTISPIRDSKGAIIGASKIARDITERKRAEVALRESEEKLRLAVEGARLGNWNWDLKTGELVGSALAFELFGLPANTKFDFGKFLATLHPDDRAMVEEAMKRTLAGHGAYDVEYRCIWPDGTERWIAAKGRAYLNEMGESIRVGGIVFDVTERRRALEHLRESEERFQAMANGIPQLAWMAEADGHIFWYNQRWYDYTGTSFEEMEGWGWQGVHHPDTLPKVMERWKGSIASGEPFEMEFPLRGADGAYRTFLTRVRPVKNFDGLVVRWLGTNTDISEREQAERQLAGQAGELSRQAENLIRSQRDLEEQSRILKLVLESVGEGLIAADREGRFIIWNDSAKKLMGREALDLPTERWTNHYKVWLPDGLTPFPPDQLPLVRALRGERVQSELIVERPGTVPSVFLTVSARPMRDAEGKLCGGVAVLRDVTESKRAQKQIQELNQELEARVLQRTAQLAEVNQELESFTYSVSHDLRAPLRHIGGFSRILVEDFGAEMKPEAQRHLHRIEEGVRRMGLLVDELLNLARVGRHALKLQPTALNPIIDEVASLLQPEAHGRQVTWKIERLPAAHCDPVLIKQVLQNLIANALKFTRPRECAVIEIDSRQEEEELVVRVHDNGVGFDMKYSDKLFGVFQRLHKAEDFEGTGIGLATVHRIVGKHGGRVWAESELGNGTNFFFTLELAKANLQEQRIENKTIAAGAHS